MFIFKHPISKVIFTLALTFFTLNFSSMLWATTGNQENIARIKVNPILQNKLYELASASQQFKISLAWYENTQLPEEIKIAKQRLLQTNFQALEKIVKQYGWPTSHLVGEGGIQATFFIFHQFSKQQQLALLPTFNSALRTKLLAMEEVDQKSRQMIQNYHGENIPEEVSSKITSIDRKNSDNLQDIINEFGWPKPSLVGVKGTSAAFLILQHAPQAMQEDLLPNLNNEFQQGNLSGQQLALLTDKVLIKAGKKQRFGTQLAIVNGDIVFNEIEDEQNLEQRRAHMGMMSMNSYKTLLKRMYKLK